MTEHIEIDKNAEIGDTRKTLNDLISTHVNGISLNYSNTTLSDIKIINAKKVIIYYIMNPSNYTNSVIIPHTSTEWAMCPVDGGYGFGYVKINFVVGYIEVSSLSSEIFKIFAYDIVYI